MKWRICSRDATTKRLTPPKKCPGKRQRGLPKIQVDRLKKHVKKIHPNGRIIFRACSPSPVFRPADGKIVFMYRKVRELNKRSGLDDLVTLL
jgi:hypothetical protein